MVIRELFRPEDFDRKIVGGIIGWKNHWYYAHSVIGNRLTLFDVGQMNNPARNLALDVDKEDAATFQYNGFNVGMLQATKDKVVYLSRTRHRQMRQSLCAQNTEAYVLDDAGGPDIPFQRLLTSSMVDMLNNKYPSAEDAWKKVFPKNRYPLADDNTICAFHRNFAISRVTLLSGLLYYKSVVVGEVSNKPLEVRLYPSWDFLKDQLIRLGLTVTS